MSRLPLEIKEKAVKLRRKGYSLKEISEKLNISKSTASLWLRDIHLPKEALERLKRQGILGQEKTRTIKRRKRELAKQKREEKVVKSLKGLELTRNLSLLCCSLLYFCEGGKSARDGTSFTNSNPKLIRLFLDLFRASFDVDESKFRILIHLHEYHNEKKQRKFWSALTGIPEEQFQKTFWKPHTKRRIYGRTILAVSESATMMSGWVGT